MGSKLQSSDTAEPMPEVALLALYLGGCQS